MSVDGEVNPALAAEATDAALATLREKLALLQQIQVIKDGSVEHQQPYLKT